MRVALRNYLQSSHRLSVKRQTMLFTPNLVHSIDRLSIDQV
jgi:hypothetical protein